MGDVIVALPALEGLRSTYPEAKISWIVERRARNILEGHPSIDQLIEFPREHWRSFQGRPFGALRALPGMRRFYRSLRDQRFDLTVDFQGNLKSGSCTFFSRAKVRLGYARSECREPNYLFTNRRLDIAGQAIHRIDRDVLLVGKVGVPFAVPRPRIAFDPADRGAGDRTVKAPHAGPPAVVLHPGTSDFMPHKRWAIENYAELGDALVRQIGARVLLSWGPGEEARIAALRDAMSEPSEVIPPTPTLKSLGYLLSRADLVVGGDTGPIHLAVVQGVPTICIMGPSDPRLHYPHGHPERAFYRRVPCSPCRDRACAQLTCLEDISPSEVVDRATEILQTAERA